MCIHRAKAIFVDALAEITHLERVAGLQHDFQQSRFQRYFDRLDAGQPLDLCSHSAGAKPAVQSINSQLNSEIFGVERLNPQQKNCQGYCVQRSASRKGHFCRPKK
jgi:hypothetical protein